MYLADPLELMESRIERMCDEIEEGKCPICKKEIDHDLIPIGPAPDSQVMCYDCLPDSAKKAYDKFDKKINE